MSTLGSINSSTDLDSMVSTHLSAGTRAAAMDTVYQPSTTKDVLVIASVSIATGVLGVGKVEVLCDSANPPTTVVATAQFGIASITDIRLLVFICKAGNYYKLKSTSVAGTPTFSLVGNAIEVSH